MVDSRLAFDIMARDDGASAVFDKVARAADKTGNSLKKTSRISDDAAKASANLTKARNAESTALDKVQVAEARLAEVRGNSNSRTSQVLTAEKALAKARRDAAVASNVAQKAAKDLGKVMDDEGKKSGKSFGAGLRKWITGSGADLGKEGGTIFGSGFLGALKTPVLGPALVATLGAAVAIAAPAVGAIAASGIVAGFGAGISALGLVFAAKSEIVQNKWKTVLAQMGADMKLLATPFEGTLISIAGIFQRTVDKFNPALKRAFQKSAVPIENFADQAARALEKLIPAIAPITDAFNAVLKALGPALQDTMGKMSDGFIKLADSVRENPGALADTARGVGDLVGDILHLITSLNDANAKFERLTGGTSLVEVTMGALRFALMGVIAPLELIAKSISVVSDGVNALSHSSNASGQSMADAAAKTVALAQGLQATGGAATHAAAPVKTLAQRTAEAKQAAAEAKQKFEDFITSLFRLQNLALTLSGAQISLKEAIANATAAAKENGKAISINTEKGRANKTALDQVAKAANDQTEAMIRGGKGFVASYTAAAASRASFVKLAVQMGYNKTTAQALAKQLIAIPNVSREARLTANKKDLETKLASAKAALNDKDLTKERRAKLNAEIAALQAKIRQAQAAIDSVHGKTVPVTIKYSTTGVNLTAPSSVGRRASGGPVASGSPYIVGEEGPELFVPSKSGTILTHKQTVAAQKAKLTKQHAHQQEMNRFDLFVNQTLAPGLIGSVQRARSLMTQLMGKVLSLDLAPRKQSRLLAYLKTESRALQVLANQRSRVAVQLKAAQSKLASAIQIRDEFKKSITDAALSFNAITNITPENGGMLDAAGIIAGMQRTLNKTAEFAANLARLKKLGLRSDLYKQIAEAGIEAGGATAAALVQGGAGAISSVNKLQAVIASASVGLGNTAANNLYQAGVDAAQGLVNGLLAKTKALELASRKLANAIVAQIKKTLGIRSPSRVLAWHGSMAGQGFAGGIESELPSVAKAADRMANMALPSPRARRGSIGSNGSGAQTIRIEIAAGNSSAYTDFLVNELRKYVRVNGGGDVQLALGR